MSNWLLDVVEPHAALVGPDPTPAQFADATLEGIPQRPLQRLVRSYGEQFWDAAPQGIAPVIWGPPGLYKSYAAAVLVRQIREVAQVRAAWCTVPVHLTQLERKRYAAETDAQIEAWKTVPFLVMDDVGMIRTASWQYDVLVEVAMARFESRHPTLWTGNILVTEQQTDNIATVMEQMLGAQLTRRIRERSEGFRIYMGKIKA